MKRDQALFEGSRLYRQADEGSRTLLDQFRGTRLPLEPTLRSISGGRSELIIDDLHTCQRILSVAKRHLARSCKSLSPYHALPILLQAISDFYYGALPVLEPAWFGTASKIALAFVWDNVFQSSLSGSKSLAQIGNAVTLAAVVEQLEHVTELYEVFGEGPLVFKGDGIEAENDFLEDAYRQIAETFEKRGEVFRTLDKSSRNINLQPGPAMEGIANVLRGGSPGAQRLFRDTLFGCIPSEEPVEFWAELWWRLNLTLLAALVRSRVADDALGLALLGTVGGTYPEDLDRNLMQKAVKQLFWQRDWYRKRIADRIGYVNNMIVERPVLRISVRPDLYATSPILIADSVNWFVEESVMRYPGRGGIPLSESVFRECVSQPFEQEVLGVFREHGFVAGKVTHKAVWLINGEGIPLKHLSGDAFPGEIDVLAYHPESEEVFVVECKVLGLPFGKEKLRNILYKLGKLDSDGFHTKLRKKIAWLEAADVFTVYSPSQVVGLIVLDRKMPGMLRGEYDVMDLGILREALSKLYGAGQ